MDYSLSAHAHRSPLSLRLSPSIQPRNFAFRFSRRSQFGKTAFPRPPALVVVARTGSSHCEPSSSSSSSSSSCNSSLNTPLELRSVVGKFLTSVFQNQRQLFHVAVDDELKFLADERDGAVNRMRLSSGSDEEFLHRRIAQLKENECQLAVEDVIYMLILNKFSEIRVQLVPKLSRCIYNGRLEIWPPKDWELESIYTFEVLEMVREHVSTLIGLRANSSVTDSWATTEILRLHFGRLYAASILYGYFLKSASTRHYLEKCLAIARQDLHLGHRTTLKFPELLPNSNLAFGHMNKLQSASSNQGSTKPELKHENLRCYIMAFDAETLQRCAKLKSKEAVSLVEKHSSALFGDDKTGLLENDEIIMTSFSSLKRLVLEAVAFGFFLWDAEEYVNTIFKLKEN